MDVKPGYWVVSCFLLIILVFVGWCLGSATMETRCQAEAVRAGHAHFVVVNEYGRVKFEWLPAIQAPEVAPPGKGR